MLYTLSRILNYPDITTQIAVLVQCGAHLTSGPHTIGEMLCSAAARGNVKRLISLMEAGADLNQPDVSNRTALHLAAHHNQVKYKYVCIVFPAIQASLVHGSPRAFV